MDLWQILGYDRTARGVVDALCADADIDVIEGPPGVGKSWLARGIGAMWESAGGSTVVVVGDEGKRDVALYPFRSAMTRLPSWSKSLIPVLTAMARAGETLVGTGGHVTEAIEKLAAAISSRRRTVTVLLTDLEQDVLGELERLAAGKPLLLIADNLHWWDPGSLDLLGRMREKRMVESFPFLTDVRILCAQTSERYQEVANRSGRDALLAPMTTRYFNLEPIPEERFGLVLASLGDMAAPSPELARAVHRLSGGHLALAVRCAERIKRGEGDLMVSAVDNQQFADRLLAERLRHLGPHGVSAVSLLQIAAVLGLGFDREEVMCASGSDERETARLLRFCRDEKILELTGEHCNFVHDHYRRYFLNLSAEDRVEFYERWSDCLRVLRSAEYDLRCLVATQAERFGEAACLGVQHSLQAQRDGTNPIDLPLSISEAIEGGELESVLTRLSSSFDCLTDYRFADCLELLDSLPRGLPRNLLAESDYLRAMCLMSTRSEEDRAHGRKLLEAWSGYELEEPELGIRIVQLLLYAYTHLEDKEEGWALEGRIRQLLMDRSGFDPAAIDGLYTLDRCAGSLYQADVAAVRNREAAHHFGPPTDGSIIRRPREYYRCLVNWSANLIGAAQYQKACEVSESAEQLVAGYPSGSFPRPDYARMNRVLAEYRAGRIEPAEAVRRQRQSVDAAPESDPFYGENALAVYLALSGDVTGSQEIFDRLDSALGRRASPEPSMTYLIRSNRACVKFQHDAQTALAEWVALSDAVDLIAYPSRPIYIRRHKLLEGILAEGTTITPVAFDEILLVRHPDEFGPLWRSFGRGFTVPAIEFWREN